MGEGRFIQRVLEAQSKISQQQRGLRPTSAEHRRLSSLNNELAEAHFYHQNVSYYKGKGQTYTKSQHDVYHRAVDIIESEKL